MGQFWGSSYNDLKAHLFTCRVSRLAGDTQIAGGWKSWSFPRLFICMCSLQESGFSVVRPLNCWLKIPKVHVKNIQAEKTKMAA